MKPGVVPQAPLMEEEGGFRGKVKEPLSPPSLREGNNNSKKNEVWNTLIDILGFEPLTVTEERLWGKVAWSLQRAGADRTKLTAVATFYHKQWPDVDLTITAIEKWYGHFLRYYEKRQRAVAAVCPSCGTGGGFHLEGCSGRA